MSAHFWTFLTHVIYLQANILNYLPCLYNLSWQKSWKYFRWYFVQTTTSKRHFEINWPLVDPILMKMSTEADLELFDLVYDQVELRDSIAKVNDKVKKNREIHESNSGNGSMGNESGTSNPTMETRWVSKLRTKMNAKPIRIPYSTHWPVRPPHQIHQKGQRA